MTQLLYCARFVEVVVIFRLSRISESKIADNEKGQEISRSLSSPWPPTLVIRAVSQWCGLGHDTQRWTAQGSITMDIVIGWSHGWSQRTTCLLALGGGLDNSSDPPKPGLLHSFQYFFWQTALSVRLVPAIGQNCYTCSKYNVVSPICRCHYMISSTSNLHSPDKLGNIFKSDIKLSRVYLFHDSTQQLMLRIVWQILD